MGHKSRVNGLDRQFSVTLAWAPFGSLGWEFVLVSPPLNPRFPAELFHVRGLISSSVPELCEIIILIS